MRARKLLSSLILLAIWLILSIIINIPVILPSPLAVVIRMIEQLGSTLFYASIFKTLFRCVVSILITAIIGISLGLLSGYSSKIEAWLSPLISIMKSFPTVSYIIILLMWLGSNRSVYVVVILVLLPIFYSNALNGYKGIDNSLLEAGNLYLSNKYSQFKEVYLPLIKRAVISSFSIASGMSLKVCVSAEVLGSLQCGVGQQIVFAKNNLDMTSVFAWTIWILIISLLLDLLLKEK